MPSAILQIVMMKTIKEKEKQNEKGAVYCDNDYAYGIPEFWTNGLKNVSG